MVINEKHAYAARSSPPTSRPSARRTNAPASCRFKSAVLKLPHINQVVHHHGCNDKGLREEWEDVDEEREKVGSVLRELKEEERAFQVGLSGEKHHQKKGKKGKKKEGYQYQYQYQDQYDRYGRPTQRQQPSPCKDKTSSLDGTQGYESTNGCNANGSAVTAPASNQHSKHKKDYKRVSMPRHLESSLLTTTQSGKMKSTLIDEPPQPEPLLIPKGRTGERSSNLRDRKRHPRLNGADLYVARLGSCGDSTKDTPTQPLVKRPSPERTDCADMTSSTSSLPALSPATTASTGSLHDELTNPFPSTSEAPAKNSNTLDLRAVRSSRPCYRCISYMHSVGIKRVFWTNDAGEWEGAKVRELVDALDYSEENGKGGPTGNGVFVTKHEVLMLRRLMGEA